MAAVQAPNQLLDMLRALRRRRYQVVVPALLIATLGCAFAVIVPKRYKVSTRIEVKETRADFDRARNAPDTAVRREASSVYDHIVNFARVKEVLERSLALWPEYVQAGSADARDQFIKQRILNRNLMASTTTKDPKGGRIFIDVTFSDEDRTRAAKFLTDLSESWLVEMFESDRNTLIGLSKELQEILDAQSIALTDKEESLYALILLLGQDPSMQTGGDSRRENRGDWTFVTLESLKTDLAAVEIKLKTAAFELEQAQKRHEQEPAVLPKRMSVKGQDPASEIARRQAQLALIEERLANKRPGHSDYKILKPKMEELAREIDELTRGAREEGELWVDEENPLKNEYALAARLKEDEVRLLTRQRDVLSQEIADFEQETKARNEHYKHLDELKNDVLQARLAVNETRQQWINRDKELQLLDSSPRPWRIAQPPLPSTATTQPNPWLIAAFAVIAGLALGVGVAVASEFLRSSYRSVSDLAAVMSVPVLGAIETILTRRERRRLQLSHAMAGLSTAAIVGTIGWITWLWYSSPERLPLEVQDAIERLRSALK